jgi:salicylate hydroxylase
MAVSAAHFAACSTLNSRLNQVEDAVTLATLFSHLSNAKQIPVFTETYQELRQHRTNETRMSEYQSLVQITLPDGPLQEERDVTLRLTLDQAFLDFDNCKSLEPVWEQYLVFFNHDAGEVA